MVSKKIIIFMMMTIIKISIRVKFYAKILVVFLKQGLRCFMIFKLQKKIESIKENLTKWVSKRTKVKKIIESLQ